MAHFLHPLRLESHIIHTQKPGATPLVRVIPACPKSEGSQAPSGLGAYFCCQQLEQQKIMHFIDYIPNMMQGNNLP